jgi:hypothetical protein
MSASSARPATRNALVTAIVDQVRNLGFVTGKRRYRNLLAPKLFRIDSTRAVDLLDQPRSVGTPYGICEFAQTNQPGNGRAQVGYAREFDEAARRFTEALHDRGLSRAGKQHGVRAGDHQQRIVVGQFGHPRSQMLPHAVGVGGVDLVEFGKLDMRAVCHGDHLNTIRVSERKAPES